MFWIVFIFGFLILTAILFASLNICAHIFIKSKCKIQNTNSVALSFDDGPHPIYTPQLLDVLQALNIKASFFVIGKNAEQYPDIIQRIVAEGHTLGHHSFYHHKKWGTLSTKKVIAEIQKTIDVLEQITGKKSIYFRSPFGLTNPNIAKAIRTLNLSSIAWSLRSYDTTYTPQMVVNKINKKLKAKDIVLMHDHLKSTPQTVQQIVKEGLKNGLKFVNLEEATLL